MNEHEVNSFAYLSMQEIKTMLVDHPQKFTTWFKIAFPQVENWWKNMYQLSK